MSNPELAPQLNNASNRFWLYRPKYNEMHNNVDEETKNAILKTDGGIWYVYTHEPTEKEIMDAFIRCHR